MKDVFVESLISIAENNPQLILLTADLGFNLFEKFIERFPGQYLNVGIAEQNMMGIAAGLALEGYKVFAYSIANFATFRCLEQIRNDICYHDLDVTIVGFGGGFSYGALGMTHHATEDMGVIRAIPNITIIAPADTVETQYVIEQLAFKTGPKYLRLEKITQKIKYSMSDTHFEIGKARCLREGNDITFIAIGSIIGKALEVAESLIKHGIQARVLSMHTLKPLDKKAIERAAIETGAIITFEEHNIESGLGSAVAQYCLEAGLPLQFFKRIGLPDVFSSIVGDREFLFNQYQINTDIIIHEILVKLKSERVG
jgi:transketolase